MLSIHRIHFLSWFAKNTVENCIYMWFRSIKRIVLSFTTFYKSCSQKFKCDSLIWLILRWSDISHTLARSINIKPNVKGNTWNWKEITYISWVYTHDKLQNFYFIEADELGAGREAICSKSRTNLISDNPTSTFRQCNGSRLTNQQNPCSCQYILTYPHGHRLSSCGHLIWFRPFYRRGNGEWQE